MDMGTAEQLANRLNEVRASDRHGPRYNAFTIENAFKDSVVLLEFVEEKCLSREPIPDRQSAGVLERAAAILRSYFEEKPDA